MSGAAGGIRTEGVAGRAMRIGCKAEDWQALRPVAGAVGGVPPGRAGERKVQSLAGSAGAPGGLRRPGRGSLRLCRRGRARTALRRSRTSNSGCEHGPSRLKDSWIIFHSFTPAISLPTTRRRQTLWGHSGSSSAALGCCEDVETGGILPSSLVVFWKRWSSLSSSSLLYGTQ